MFLRLIYYVILFYGGIMICSCVRSSADGHLGCFYLSATVSSAAMNMRVNEFVCSLWHIYQGVEFLGRMVRLCLTF